MHSSQVFNLKPRFSCGHVSNGPKPELIIVKFHTPANISPRKAQQSQKIRNLGPKLVANQASKGSGDAINGD